MSFYHERYEFVFLRFHKIAKWVLFSKLLLTALIERRERRPPLVTVKCGKKKFIVSIRSLRSKYSQCMFSRYFYDYFSSLLKPQLRNIGLSVFKYLKLRHRVMIMLRTNPVATLINLKQKYHSPDIKWHSRRSI